MAPGSRAGTRHRAPARLLVALALAVLALAGCGQAATGNEKKRTTMPSAQPTTAGQERLPVGVYAPDALSSWASVTEFGQQAGQPVRYVVAYLGPDDEFPEQLALDAAAHGAELVLQLEPTMPMAQIAAGGDDGYLVRLADAIRDYGYPVIVSFAAEANGNWYGYGWTRTPVADYQAGWAHVMQAMRDAANVTWMDTINRDYEGAGPVADYVIPGVDLYGIDAYYVSADDTFDTVILPTLSQIRAVTDKPVMISETGIGPVSGQVKSIPGLVQGAVEHHLAALVYFNSDQGTESPYHQNWALTPAGLATLRQSLAG
jgi:hypothetical protein